MVDGDSSNLDQRDWRSFFFFLILVNSDLTVIYTQKEAGEQQSLQVINNVIDIDINGNAHLNLRCNDSA